LPDPETRIEISSECREEKGGRCCYLTVRVANVGDVASWLGSGAFTLELSLPGGRLQAVECLESFSCEAFKCAKGPSGMNVEPCAMRRANLLRFNSRWWPAGARAEAVIKLNGAPVEPVAARIQWRTSDGEMRMEEMMIPISGR
jgi:hypothetical protein